jgi:predicted DNA-binding WGR domain protein
MAAVQVRRIDPACNMHRFYRPDVQPDLFGGVLLVKKWGRIGAHEFAKRARRAPRWRRAWRWLRKNGLLHSRPNRQ